MAMKISGFIKGNFHTGNYSDQIQNASFDSNPDGISKKKKKFVCHFKSCSLRNFNLSQNYVI